MWLVCELSIACPGFGHLAVKYVFARRSTSITLARAGRLSVPLPATPPLPALPPLRLPALPPKWPTAPALPGAPPLLGAPACVVVLAPPAPPSLAAVPPAVTPGPPADCAE